MRRVAALVIASLAVSCGKGGSPGPWLTDPGVKGHSRYFPLAGTQHDPTAAGATITCESCHSGATFAQFDCITCHTSAITDSLHAAVASYTHTSSGCYACHPQGTVAAPADHDTAFFPRGTGSAHAAVTCTQCHANLSDPTNTALFLCSTCHAGLNGFSTAHAQVSGVTSATPSAQCLTCHGDSQVNKVADHTQFPVVLASSTHDTVCLECHTTLRTDKPFAADFSAFSCTGCHLEAATDPAHASVSGYLYASASCYHCHPGGTAGAPQTIVVGGFTIPSPPASSPTTQAGIAGLPHPSTSTVACTVCHTGGVGGKLAIGYDHASALASSSCDACHEAGSDEVGHPWNGATSLSAGAGDTRPFTLPSVPASSGGDSSTETYPNHFFLDRNGAQVDCFNCHQAPAGVAAATTGTTYSSAWAFKHPAKSAAQDFCYQCHPNGPPN